MKDMDIDEIRHIMSLFYPPELNLNEYKISF